MSRIINKIVSLYIPVFASMYQAQIK
ncbi:hypothetical protein SKA34_01112 [Photobacterium sp. SKA34]|nr:hypothetical protein SKA34_01112 [Photobacterium sp. SKA34]